MLRCHQSAQDIAEALDAWKAEAEECQLAQRSFHLLAYSDASYYDKGDHSTASYGWVITGIDGCGHTRAHKLTGGGIVHGSRRYLHSTRAESVGALSAIMFMVHHGWTHDFVLRLDNSGVVARQHHWDLDSVEPYDWMTHSDPDTTAEMEAWMHRHATNALETCLA